LIAYTSHCIVRMKDLVSSILVDKSVVFRVVLNTSECRPTIDRELFFTKIVPFGPSKVIQSGRVDDP
jgi:hypothetical protein